ncbi:hypothetical protein BDV25DRAFT_135236 [Aspergillus avenaceus]|uniref:Uncharacterized protein n=1 Tax=Aspergillus avenaceus TaxID=36643 RepID=A0A5N6U9T9_ASPAV|nr:hypothetical protein BDV25DRAFT_135236 [Aspergillus avenaceus]
MTSATAKSSITLQPETALSRGLQIPTKSSHITSGFEYPPILQTHNISPADWSNFTSEITSQARLTRAQWSTAVGRGLGVLAVGGLMIGFLGAIPAYVVARKVQRNREEQNMVAATGEDGLGRTIREWNEGFFEPRGVVIRVDLPFEEVEDIGMMDVFGSAEREGVKGWWEGVRGRRREDAQRKARIVIIPIPMSEVEMEGKA